MALIPKAAPWKYLRQKEWYTESDDGDDGSNRANRPVADHLDQSLPSRWSRSALGAEIRNRNCGEDKILN